MTLATVLCCAMTLTALTSCTDDDIDDNPVPAPTEKATEPTEPTEDALSVTTDKSYVLYGEW